MSEENEEVVIDHPLEKPVPNMPDHIHHGRLVLCKKGTEKITLEPILKAQGETRVGHEGRWAYGRTADVDSLNRVIFRPEGV